MILAIYWNQRKSHITLDVELLILHEIDISCDIFFFLSIIKCQDNMNIIIELLIERNPADQSNKTDLYVTQYMVIMTFICKIRRVQTLLFLLTL